jgi:uncharacterized protein
METLERRAFEDRPVTFRAAPEGSDSPGVLTGYGYVFNQLSRDLGGWFERIAPASVDLENNGRIIGRLNHDSNGLLGTTDAGTLRIKEDEAGGLYEIDLPDTSTGRDVAVLAKRGDLAFSSFAFRVLPGGVEWSYGPNDELIRTVTRMQVSDVSPVADPAYWGTSAELTRNFDLDAIRASLKPEETRTGAPPWLAHKRSLLERTRA